MKQPFLAVTGSDPSVAGQFILNQLSSQNSFVDLIYWDLAGPSSLDPLAAATLLSRDGVVCVSGAGELAALKGTFLDTLELILKTPQFSVFARRDGDRSIRSMRYKGRDNERNL